MDIKKKKISSVYAEQVRQLFTSMPAALVANIVASILLITVQWPVIEKTILISWLGFSVLIILARLVLLLVYRKQQDPDLNSEYWGRLFDLGVVGSALTLGLSGVLLFPAGNELHQVLLAFVLVGMSAGAVSSLSVGRRSFPLYITITLTPLVISLLFEASRLSLLMVPMVMLAYLFIFKSSRSIYVNNEQNIKLGIEAKNRQDELLKIQQKQILHFMNTPLGFIEWTPEFKVAEWNPAAEKIFGYRREQVLGAYGPDLIIPKDVLPVIDLIWDDLVKQKGGRDSINSNLTADGETIICEWHNTPLVNKEGDVIGVASTVQDITERTKTETEIFEARNMLQIVLNTIPARVFWKDRNNNYLGCNSLFAADAGLSSPDEIIGHNDFEMPWKDQAQTYQDDDNEVMDNNMPRIAYEEEQTQHDGKTVWVETSKIPLKNTHGVIYGVLGTYHDITVRKQAVDEILRAKNEAERANNAKSEFLSRMSHELRTPLNAILGFAQLIEMSKQELAEKHHKGINHILSAGRHLLDLINEVLDISKIDAGEVELEIEPFNLDDVVNDVFTLVSPIAKERDVTLEYKPAQSIAIRTDKIRLKQVLLNLISNAVKYNKVQGKVDVEARVELPDILIIRVKDTGIGIKKEDYDRVLEPFGRVVGSASSEAEGTGIGLTITVKLLTLMQARLNFESVFGEGSIFEIEMPLEIKKH